MRVFSNDNGGLIQAELLSHKGGKVKLKRADGKEFEADPSIFSADDEAFIMKWMKNTPESRTYNLRVASEKKKVEGTMINMGYKRVRNDLWSYIISVTNNSKDPVSDLTFKYRVFYSNSADGAYSSSSPPGENPLQMIEGEVKLGMELGPSRTFEITTTPVRIDLVDYEGAGYRYKDELKGCLLRVENKDEQVVIEWVSPDVAMKNRTWSNTNTASGNTGVIR